MIIKFSILSDQGNLIYFNFLFVVVAVVAVVEKINIKDLVPRKVI